MINTYRELLIFLDNLENSDITDEAIKLLNKSNMDLSGNINIKVDTNFESFIDKKVKKISLDFQEKISVDAFDINNFHLNLTVLKENYKRLLKLSQVKLISEKAQEKLKNHILTCAHRYKESLENNFDDELKRLLQNTNLDNLED